MTIAAALSEASTQAGNSLGGSLGRLTLAALERALLDQQDLTAVERFSQHHEHVDMPLGETHYRALLPATTPGAGQQYAFEVDLDLCTGCKACVVACHSLNGLDEGESFRTVGLVHGGTTVAPFQQTVTSACHHCLDPACANGCPVLAYEKDPVTGIVRHLDDQCIGCQYCVLTCPYEVPRFHADKGIVRKCDMCAGRLQVGEAPACVQACPNGAIAIQIVDVARVIEASEVGSLVSGAPASSITQPTTTYRSAKSAPSNALPADYHAVRPAGDHLPLVVMLVLTQLSVGAFAVERVVRDTLPMVGIERFSAAHAVFSLAIGLIALAASVSHLGRPLGAFRAVLGLRRSWLSREILAFGAFAMLAVLYAASTLPSLPWFVPAALGRWHERLGNAVIGVGAFGVFCSAMLYHVTRREFWNLATALPKFALTSAILGIATMMATLVAVDVGAGTSTLSASAHALRLPLVGAVVVKLGIEFAVLVHLRDPTQTELRRSAVLLSGALRDVVMLRVLCAFVGAVALPVLFLDGTKPSAAMLVGVSMALVVLLIGELLERSTFFRAQRNARMPGGFS